MINKHSINKVLVALRIQSGLSRQEVADKLDMSVANYWKIEAGNTMFNLPTLFKLAEAFNTEAAEIVARITDKSTIQDLKDEVLDLHRQLYLIQKQDENSRMQSM